MSIEPLILVVDDEQHTREGLRGYLESCGYHAVDASSGEDALKRFKKEKPDIVLTDLKMPDMDGIELLRRVHDISPATTVVVLTAYGTVETAVKAMKAGAFHYLTKPVNFDELELVIKKALNQRHLETENRELKEALADHGPSYEIVGSSKIIKNLIREVKQVAPSKASVLIEGESGTGKELFARLIHNESDRRQKAFVTVHCAALTETLLTSELFGHERGAFTGATERKIGRFERAHGGTLFLDEIAELKEDMQVKLLRVLQDGNFERVGSTTPIHADIRLVCATNKNLAEQVQKKLFREDLYYRINVVRLTVPPLRDRADDIPELVGHFLKFYSQGARRDVPTVTPEAMAILKDYRWPGNIRELRNVIERMVALASDPVIDVGQIPSDIKGGAPLLLSAALEAGTDLRGAEKKLISDRMKQFGGNKAKVARSLGISRRTLYRKIDEYELKF